MIPYPYNRLKLQDETERHFLFYCPFHKEKQPSFTVNKMEPFKLYYRCWGCGRNGSATKFAKVYLGHKNPNIKEFTVRTVERPVIDWNKRLASCTLYSWDKIYLATNFGVSKTIFDKFLIRKYWDVNKLIWKFMIPMYNEKGICGIQEHYFKDGEHIKKCQRHSQHGYFSPKCNLLNELRPLYICEGFSDAAVAIECGVEAIGRFNALDLKIPEVLLQQGMVSQFIIVSDTDKVGISGSKKLQQLIPNSKILIPRGYKDLRELYLDRGKEFTTAWLKGEIYLS